MSPLLPHIHPSSLITEWSVKSMCLAVSVFPVVVLNIRIDSSPDETMCWPSGENATDLTVDVCPVNGPASVSPVVALHTRIFPSKEPETMRWPSGENATDLTQYMCPVNGPASVSPVLVFRTIIVPSRVLETIRWPSGENATDATEDLYPVDGPATFSPVVAFHT